MSDIILDAIIEGCDDLKLWALSQKELPKDERRKIEKNMPTHLYMQGFGGITLIRKYTEREMHEIMKLRKDNERKIF